MNGSEDDVRTLNSVSVPNVIESGIVSLVCFKKYVPMKRRYADVDFYHLCIIVTFI